MLPFASRKQTTSPTKNCSFSLAEAQLSNGQSLTFPPGEIVIFVGPNNSGKSTFLKEIRQYLKDPEVRRRALSKLTFTGASEREIEERVETYFRIMEEGGLKFVLNVQGRTDFYLGDFHGGPSNLKLGEAVRAFIAFLNSEGRLLLSKDVETIDLLLNRPQHPYHVFMVSPPTLERFSAKIQEAFGLQFTITRIGNPIRGYVGRDLPTGDSLASDRKIPDVGELVQDQGDGLRSYAGIIGEIIVMSHPIILVDEPEAFLHPPQARRLGRTIVAELEPTRQAFIATHSSDFLQGILAAQSSRVRVIRLDRKEVLQTVTVLQDRQLREAVDHPSIANSNLLDSLFFDRTVLCEGDADCKLFEWISRGADNCDRFWFSAGGKHQFPKVAGLLHSFAAHWRAILDLDALTNWELLNELACLKGLDIAPFKRRIRSALRMVQPVESSRLRREATSALESDTTDEMALRDVARILEGRKFSSALKQHGVSAIPNGQERSDVDDFLAALDSVGICLLRRGEVECYVPSVGNHGPAWVSAVLENSVNHTCEFEELKSDIRPALN